MIDLRSDAVTHPTEAMWEAMRRVRVGWALVGEDASVTELEHLATKLSDKEASLFVPTATMANLVALMSHTRRGDQVILEASSHILWSEEQGFARICGLAPRVIQGESGYMAPPDVRHAIEEQRLGHRPRTSLICLENTHNLGGGAIITPPQVGAIAAIAREYDIPIHLDGARVFNAAVAMGEELKTLVKDIDTLTISLTKGLSAPQGALLCGPKPFVEESRSNLRTLGGASIHQAGIFAAAGLVALQTMLPQLAADNRRAQMLARGLIALNSGSVRTKPVQTNIVLLSIDSSCMSACSFAQELASSGILASVCAENAIRFVTHRHISDGDIESVIHAVSQITDTH
jgi:threonine aldolase